MTKKYLIIATLILAVAGHIGNAKAATISQTISATGNYTLSDVYTPGNINLNAVPLSTRRFSTVSTSAGTLFLANSKIVNVKYNGVDTRPTGLTRRDHYLSVHGPIGSTVFSLNTPTTGFGFEWGTVDDYNQVMYQDGNDAFHFISGSTLLSLMSTMPLIDDSIFINITDLAGIKNIMFLSGGNSFEVANMRISSVPLPAALPLFAAGLAGLFGYSRRKTTA